MLGTPPSLGERGCYVDPGPFQRDRLGFLAACARTGGDVSCFRLGFRRAFFLANPVDIRRLLAVEPRDLRRSAVTRLTAVVLGNSVFNANGAANRDQRKCLIPFLHAGKLSEYSVMMSSVARNAIASLRHDDRVAASSLSRRVALGIGSRAMFGFDLGQEAGSIDQALRTLFCSIDRFDRPRDWLSWTLPSMRNLRVVAAVRTLRRIARETIEEGRSSPEAAGTLLGSLIRLCDRGAISERLVQDEVTLLTVAGHETTAQALTWTLYLVAAHFSCQARLHAEIVEAFGADDVSAEACVRLPLLSSVVKESLRLYPPSPIIDRCAMRPLQLGGWTIPAQRTVFVSPFVTQRDPRFFRDPDRFDPDRWAQPQPALAAAAYFPFGSGPRRCLGEAFATAEMTIVLATILQKWEIALDDEGPVEPEVRVTLRPKREVVLRVKRRPSAPLASKRAHP